MLSLMREIRAAIQEDQLPSLREQFLSTYRVADYDAGKRDREVWLRRLKSSEAVSDH